jgi:hypothetical protein
MYLRGANKRDKRKYVLQLDVVLVYYMNSKNRIVTA